VSGFVPVADKTAWPELVGMPAAEAQAIVEAEGAGVVQQIQCTAGPPSLPPSFSFFPPPSFPFLLYR
jgi:hypothetical protein